MERWVTKKTSAVRGEMPWFPPGSESEIRAYKGATSISSNHRTSPDNMKLVSDSNLELRFSVTVLKSVYTGLQELKHGVSLNINYRKLKRKGLYISHRGSFK
jgi:hypothetical protein